MSTNQHTHVGNWSSISASSGSDAIITGHLVRATNLEENGMEMKTLYNVIVVDAIDGEVLIDEKVVAKDQRGAEFLAEVDIKLREMKYLPEDVSIICYSLGSVKIKKDEE